MYVVLLHITGTNYALYFILLTLTSNIAYFQVRWDVFKEYAHSVGYSYALIIVLVYALYEASAVLANIWLSNWTDDSQLNNLTALPANSSARQERNNHYLYLYGGMGAAQGKTNIIQS